MRISRQLIFIICAYFLIRLPWLFFVPMVEAPDEFSHYWVFRFMAEHMRLPSAVEVALGGPSGVYGSLPQMGYIPHVLVCKIFPIGDLSLVGRFGSLFTGLIAVIAAYFLGVEIFTSSLCALALPVMMLFHPQLVFVNSYSNSDTTTCALTTVLMYLCARVLKIGVTGRTALLIGFLLGWTALTKYSGVAIFPATAIALFLSFYIHRVSPLKCIKYLFIVGGMFFATCGWWFVHSMEEFHGDILGTRTMRETWARTYNKPLEFHMSVSRVIKDPLWWSTVHDSYWGLFGYVNKFLWQPVYYVYLGFLFLAIACGARDLVAELAKSKLKAKLGALITDRIQIIQPAVWLTLATCCFTNLAAMIIGSSMNLGGAQGRYLFPSEAALMALLIAGVFKIGKSYGQYSVMALMVFNAVVCIGSFIMLWNTPGYSGFITKLY